MDIIIKPFHKCNAHVEINGRGDEMLVSYFTPVVVLRWHESTQHYSVFLSPKWRCTATTRQQVSRFLREHDLNYHDVKAQVEGKPFTGTQRAIVTKYDDAELARRFHRL